MFSPQERKILQARIESQEYRRARQKLYRQHGGSSVMHYAHNRLVYAKDLEKLRKKHNITSTKGHTDAQRMAWGKPTKYDKKTFRGAALRAWLRS